MRKGTRFFSAGLALCLLLSLIPAPVIAVETAAASDTLSEALPSEVMSSPLTDEGEADSSTQRNEAGLSALSDETGIYSGYCGGEGDGKNVSWELNLGAQALTLTITGSGRMADYQYTSSVPWYSKLYPYNSVTNTTKLTVTVGEGITHLSKYFNCGMEWICESISLPSTLESIGASAFNGQYTGLPERLEIPASVKEIGNSAFYQCRGVKELVLTNPDTVYGSSVFSMCENLSSVTLPDGMTAIPAGFLSSTAITQIQLPESVTAIGDSAFESCSSLSAVNFPSGLLSIGDRAFPGAALSGELDLPDTLQDIGAQAFNKCQNVTGFHWPAALRSVGEHAFSDCGLTGSLTLPEEVTFGDYAFGVCESLSSLTLPSDEALLGDYLFYYCTGLTSVAIPDTWTSIPNYMFQSCKGLTTCTIPEGVRSIGRNAFCYCTSLSSAALPESIQTIGSYAFEYCSALPSLLVLPASVTSISFSAYASTKISSVRFLGDAPSCVEATSSKPSFPTTTVLYYTPGKSGWTSPTWNEYAAYPILGEGSYEFHDGDYYSSLSLRNFDFVADIGPQAEQPVSGVTLTYQGKSIDTGDGPTSISAAISIQENTEISFTRSDMFDISLPVKVLSTFNTVEFYPKTGTYSTTKPFVQAVYARHSEKDDYTDLLHDSLKFYAGSLTEQTYLYIQVNWNGQSSGQLYLSQTLDPADGWPVEEGFTKPGNISFRLKADQGLYLLMEYSGNVEAVQLGAVLLAEDQNIDLVLGDTFDASVPNDTDQFLSEFKFGIDLPKDISLSLTVKRDGTVQALLGLQVAKESDSELAFDTIKDALEYQNQKENGLDLEGLAHLLESRGQKVVIQKSQFVVSCSASILGYAEGKMVKYDNGQYGIVLSKGTVGISFAGGMTQTFQFYAASVPFYVSGSIKPKLSFNITLYSNESDASLLVKPISASASLTMKVAGGLGLDSIASAGIYGAGTGTVTFTIPLSKDKSSCTFQGSIGAEATFFCFSADLVIFKSDEIYLWGEQPTAAALSLSALEEADWQPQSRDYLGTAPAQSASLFSVGEENTVLEAGQVSDQGIYPYASVQTAALSGGRQVAVWTDDPGTTQRPDENNRTMLYYSYYNGSTWTPPQPVESTDDGTADFNPKLKTLNDTVYLLWQDASRSLNGDDTEKTTPALLDISCCRFDPITGAFAAMEKMNDFGTDHYDSAMDMTMIDGKFAVVWVSNSANSPFGGSEQTYSIHRLIEGETEPVTLVTDLYLVDGLAADGEDIWFSADTDGNRNTLSDREIFHYDGTTLEQVTHNQTADLKPSITGGQLLWYSDGVLQNGQDTVALAADTDRYQYLRSDAGMEAIVYLDDDEFRKTTLYASFNDGSGWGEPIPLTGTAGNIGSFSAVFLSDGTLSITACRRELDSNQDNYLSSDSATLATYSVTPYCDLAIEKVTYLEQSLVKGGKLDIPVQVANHGMANVDIVTIQVEGSSGQDLGSSVIDASLASGQSDTFYISIPLEGDLTACENLTVQVSALGYTDKTPEDNSDTLSLRLSDVSVEGAVASSDGTTTQVKALVVNRGQTDLGALTVNLYDSGSSTPLATQTVTAPASGEGTFVTFQVEKGIANNRFLTVEATVDGLEPVAENLSSNNSCIAVVKGPRAEALTLALQAVTGEDGTVSAISTVQNTTQAAQQYSLYFAAYRADGKLLDSRILAGQTTDPGGQSYGQVEFSCSEISYVQVFMLDGDYAPLAAAETCPV